MKKRLLIVVAMSAALSGCSLVHTESDQDALRYAAAWETPGLAQQPVQLKFATEGPVGNWDRARQDAVNVLWNSGKFRIAGPDEDAAYRIDVTLSVRRKTHWLKTTLNAAILYAWPIDAQDYSCEVFIDIRKPTGELVGHIYAQGRGKATLWLGYALWPKWLWNTQQAAVIRRDTLKAAVFKTCRALMPKGKE